MLGILVGHLSTTFVIFILLFFSMSFQNSFKSFWHLFGSLPVLFLIALISSLNPASSIMHSLNVSNFFFFSPSLHSAKQYWNDSLIVNTNKVSLVGITDIMNNCITQTWPSSTTPGGHDSFRPIFPGGRSGDQFFMPQSENPVFDLNLTKLTLI